MDGERSLRVVGTGLRRTATGDACALTSARARVPRRSVKNARQEGEVPGEPSAYQQRIYDFVAAGRGHGVIRATAGSGKTTTLVEIARRLPPDLAVCFLAFGKDAATELQKRLPKGIEARTVHAAGFRAMATYLRSRGLRPEIDAYKYSRLVSERLSRSLSGFHVLDEDEQRSLESYVAGLVTFARLNLADTGSAEEIGALSLRHGLPVPASPALEQEARRCLPLVLDDGARVAFEQGICDFDDLLHLPHVHARARPGLRPRRYDMVFVDEAQDYSRLALEFTLRLCRPHGRMLFVGDPRQSIFGFAGADPGAMRRIVQATGATQLPLSVSYRCPRAHVSLARRVAGEIEAAPGAAGGNVLVVENNELERVALPGSLVLSRTNAPLLRTCMRLVRAGRRVNLRGHDLVAQLLALAAQLFGAEARVRLPRRLEAYEHAEASRISAGLGDGAAARQAMLEVLALSGCLMAAAGRSRSGRALGLTALASAVRAAFAARGRVAVVCSTIHRAKGQEAERVILLDPEDLLASDARTRDDILAEECVMFVALTRAKRDLVFVRCARRDRLAERADAYLERAAA